ncbi:uncharacterized protein LOC130725013 [Lotus japonicus]|uniref:uncharacterized protein LOC130725013 n=1 Tax=Lotus japonicus TaxID=34305 RepID=UPI0025842BED|nr:uncharacterized protein LOC130725013 [Lotus japonicus]
MWEVFSRWGEVQEVFIPFKRNREGRKFGFVRFFVVSDPVKLRRQLDQIIIGCTKLHVNPPRFEIPNPQRLANSGYQTRSENLERQPRTISNQAKGYPRSVAGKKSYAEAVSGGEGKAEPHKNILKKQQIKQGKAKGETVAQLWVEDSIDEWLQRCWVGKIQNISMIDKLQETMIIDGIHSIKARFMGDDLFLLSGEQEENLEDTIKRSEDWMNEMFSSLVPWSPKISLEYRMVWVRCYGFPLHVWKRNSLEKLISPIGSLIEMETSTESMSCIEFAR